MKKKCAEFCVCEIGRENCEAIPFFMNSLSKTKVILFGRTNKFVQCTINSETITESSKEPCRY